MPRTWEQLLARFKEDPEFEKTYKDKAKAYQRHRMRENPAARESRRLAKATWRDKIRYGLPIRPYVKSTFRLPPLLAPLALPQIFSVSFD